MLQSNEIMVTIREGKRADCPAVYQLIQELAVYEKAADQVEITEEELAEDGFGLDAIYHLLVAEQDDQIIGIALYYIKYSTWKGKCVYLEDLIVTEKYRGVGAGKLLFEELIKIAAKLNAGRMEWQVLDWNEPAIGFYKKYNAELDGEWFNAKFRREQLQELSKKLK